MSSEVEVNEGQVNEVNIAVCTEINQSRPTHDCNNIRNGSTAGPRQKSNTFNFIVTNARSLAPKIQSLADCFEELDLGLALITESWLRDGKKLSEYKDDLEMGEEIELIHRNRQDRKGKKRVGGGVVIAFNKIRMRLTERRIRRGKTEIVAAQGKIPGLSRKIFVLCAYIPPKTRSAQAEEFMNNIHDAIEQAKQDLNDPLIIVGGDFNRFNHDRAVGDFPDLVLIPTGPTRGDEALDLVWTNFDQDRGLTEVRNPLTTEDGRSSDHSIIHVKNAIRNSDRFKWIRIKTRQRNKKNDEKFNDWIKAQDWNDVTSHDSPDDMAEALVELLNRGMNLAFPITSKKIRSTDDPWITNKIRGKIEDRKKIYAKEDRSLDWKEMKKYTNDLISKSKKEYYDKYVKEAKEKSDPGLYYKMISRLKSKEAPKPFRVQSLFEKSKSDDEIAELVADFFTKISDGFTPLSPDCLQRLEESNNKICLQRESVAKRLASCKKPKGLLSGDIFPDLLSKYAVLLATPVTAVLNAAFDHETWPKVWKRETVSVIPKNSSPAGLSEMRNISCTPVLSKVMEFFLLERLRSEVKVKTNQFGGIPGCGIDHYLVEVWDSILQNLDQPSSVSTLISVDFAKAFNTMSHQACLAAFQRKGSTPHSTRMIASFLSGREMLFRVGDSLSSPRPLNGGSPQGTLLGNFMFIITTDDLEDFTSTLPVTTDDSSAEQPRSPVYRTGNTVLESVTSTEESGSAVDNDRLSDPEATDTPWAVSVNERTPTRRNLGHNLSCQVTPYRPTPILLTSTPRIEYDDPDPGPDLDSFVYFNNRRTPHNRIEDTLCPIYTLPAREREELSPPPNYWRSIPMMTFKYVDDFISSEKSRLQYGIHHLSQNKQMTHIHAQGCEEFFLKVSERAAAIGMSVNQKKTQILCMSPAISCDVQAYIKAGDGTKIFSQDSLKQLGFFFGKRPNADEHVGRLIAKFRRRIWLLRHLKRARITKEDLVALYKCFLLPVLDSSSVVYHSILTADQSAKLENLQARTLKIIYGSTKSYRETLEESGLERLSERRLRLVDKFIVKCATSDRFKDRWFPRELFKHADLRNELLYREFYARTDRLYNSPLFFYRRRLNEIHLHAMNKEE